MTESVNDSKQWIFDCVLGSGAFGVIELWKNITTMEKIAVKKCQISKNKLTPRQKERWQHEVMIINQLNHPNIVSTCDIPNDIIQCGHGLPILCMEYCTKGDLRSVLNKSENFCGIQLQDAMKIMQDVSSAVEYIHNQKITHRDLKPDNIVIQQMNNKIVYKLIDLGYAKELDDISVSASIVGTLNYLAPELLWKETYSCSVDYWSLGILFYEIITGTRPFLPNMQLTNIWMKHVQQKQYEHISVREVNGKIYFFNDIEDPTSIPDCLKFDLVEWFRIVFQWDPKKRGKLKDGELAVFTLLKSISDKKIVHAFMVNHLKFESYIVNLCITIRELKQIIQEKDGISESQQILTDSMGIILNDQESLSDRILEDDIIIVFHSEKLHIESIPKSKLSHPVQEMIKQPRSDYDYYTLRRFYGATIFFMKNELKLYQSYILALSITIDLVDARLKLLSRNIEKLNSDKKDLESEMEATSKLMEKCIAEKYKQDFAKLREKINKFIDGIKQMMEKFNILIQNNEELKNFSNIDWMSEISTPYDRAVNVLNEWNTENYNRRDKPCLMVKLVFEFLAARDKKLSSPQLDECCRNIMQFKIKLIQLEKVFTSFVEVMKFYLKDIVNLHAAIVKEYEQVERASGLDNKNKDVTTNITEIVKSFDSSTNNALTTDSVIYKSIVTANMLEGLLTEMDIWKRKFATLSNFDD